MKKILQIILIIAVIAVISIVAIIVKNNEKEFLTNKNMETKNGLDEFYTEEITSKYTDIRKLEKEYNKEKAREDNCFVIGAMVYNDNLYTDFMNNYNNKKSSFIRVVQTTTEGDAILCDIKYDEKKDKIYIVKDSTRDDFASEDDRIISLKEYNNIGKYEYKESMYWVAYNEEINEENFYDENTFIITVIN